MQKRLAVLHRHLMTTRMPTSETPFRSHDISRSVLASPLSFSWSINASHCRYMNLKLLNLSNEVLEALFALESLPASLLWSLEVSVITLL